VPEKDAAAFRVYKGADANSSDNGSNSDQPAAPSWDAGVYDHYRQMRTYQVRDSEGWRRWRRRCGARVACAGCRSRARRAHFNPTGVPPTHAPPHSQTVAFADRMEAKVFSFNHGRMTVWEAFSKLKVGGGGEGRARRETDSGIL
jgi:hypothetical protein